MKFIFKSLLFLVFITPLISFGQTNFKKGSLVTSTGDTLKGFIDYQEWVKNPETILFKTTLNQNENQEFTPATSKYFAIENIEQYESYEGRVSADKTDFNNIPKTIDTSRVLVQAFLKILQKGENVTLYALNDDVKIRFFIRDNKAHSFQELGFRRYIDPEREDKIRASKNYMGQLLTLATKYNVATPALKRQIELSDYTSVPLIKIVSVINNISKKEVNKNSGNSALQFFAGAGINYSTTSLVGNHELDHPDTDNKSSVLPKIVIGINAFLNPNVRKVVIRGELALTKTNQLLFREYVDDEVGGRKDIMVRQEIKQNIISFSPQVLYNFYNSEHLKFFAGSGLSANLVSYPLNSYYREVTYNGANTTKQGPTAFYKLESFWIIVPIKVGVAIKKLELSAIYFPPTTISKYAQFAFETKTAHIQLNYLITK